MSPAFFILLVYFFINMPYYTLQKLSENAESLKMVKSTGILNDFSGSSLIESSAFIMIFISLGMAFSFAAEKQNRTMEELVRMPYSRLNIYLSKVIIAAAFIILPLVINMLLFFALGNGNEGFNMFVNRAGYVRAAQTLIIVSLYVYFFFVAVSMIFGNVLAAFICGVIFMSFPVSLVALVTLNTGYNPPDSFMSLMEALSPMAFLGSSGLVLPAARPVMLILTLIFAEAGYVLFTTNKMEKNTEFLTYSFLEPVFKIGVFVCCVLAGRLIMKSMLYDIGIPVLNSGLGVVLGGLAGFFVPKILISRAKQV